MRTMPKTAVALLGIIVASGGAMAATTVIGGGLARSCYEAALFDRATQESMSVCNRALSEEALTQHDRVATHVNRGILKLQLRHIDSAIDDFDRATALDPTEPEAYLNKAVALMTREEGWREAIPLFDAAIEKDTRKPELAYFGRAIANERAGDVKAAYLDYKRAAAVAPEWDDPVKELARFQVVKRGS